MAFETEQIRLSMRGPDNARYLTANVYTVDGIEENGIPRQLSIGQLVMAICLERATKTEAKIVQIMAEMNSASEALEKITKIEEALVNKLAELGSFDKYECDDFSEIGLDHADFADIKNSDGEYYYCWDTYLNHRFNLDMPVAASKTQAQFDECIAAMESKMDEYNTLNQQKMIELQSQTNKRDQSYDLMSAILKSLNNTIIGTVNNF